MKMSSVSLGIERAGLGRYHENGSTWMLSEKCYHFAGHCTGLAHLFGITIE